MAVNKTKSKDRGLLFLIIILIVMFAILVISFVLRSRNIITDEGVRMIFGLVLLIGMVWLFSFIIFEVYKNPSKNIFQKHINLISNLFAGFLLILLLYKLFRAKFSMSINHFYVIMLFLFLFYIIAKLCQRKKRKNKIMIFREMINEILSVIFPALIVVTVTGSFEVNYIWQVWVFMTILVIIFFILKRQNQI